MEKPWDTPNSDVEWNIASGPAMSPITVTQIGQPALTALAAAVESAQQADGDDPFARVVVVTAHRDVAASVRHLLGAHNVLNVTAQTGERLAAELARPILSPAGDDGGKPPRRALNRLHESQAVRRVADEWLASDHLPLSLAGRRRLYGELAGAFRQWEQRPALDDADAPLMVSLSNHAGLDLPSLYDKFRALLDRDGYYTRYELPRLAAQALPDHWPPGAEPAVIYYLPRHPTAGELELMQVLLGRGKCRVIIGLNGDTDADGPALALYDRLTGGDAATDGAMPLQRAVASNALSVTVAPDPVEEVRAVVRRIIASADDVPFHRIAVVHRQESPYASLLRQELDFAGITSSGVPRRTLADTGAGRFLLGALALIASMDGGADAEPTIDREQFIDLVMSCPVQFPPNPNNGRRRRPVEVPATQWAELARAARANGTVREWAARLAAYVEQQVRRERERSGEPVGTGPPGAGVLSAFIDRLAPRLRQLRRPDELDWTWQSAAERLKALLVDYLRRTEGEGEDYRRIEEVLDGLAGLADWDIEYDADVLRETIGDELQSPVSHRGNPVGSGVYVGPPAGIVGAQYHMVFAVGMAEGQFPPSQRASIVDEWRDAGAAALTRRALERYEFLGVVASADRAMLSYAVAGANRRMAYPSPWLLEAANLLHEAIGSSERLTSENLTTDATRKPWLTVIPSREAGLRQLAASVSDATLTIAPADLADYNLMHLLANAGGGLASHPAWSTDASILNALAAREARLGTILTEWDGRVGSGSRRITDIGVPDRPVSPSALETWAACPYRYFLSRVLGISPPPVDDEEGEISALDRGVLVHRILEEFVNRNLQSEDELLALADAEFAAAEGVGITGYPRLWEMEKETIRAGLRRFFAADAEWLGGPPLESRSEQNFDDVRMDVPGLGTVRFRGKIDRLDVLADEVRVRDFKTGNPRRYLVGSRGGQPDYTIANGRALQLPVYVAGARQLYPDASITASYCFPLSDDRIYDPRPYHDADGLGGFHDTLRRILGMARSGVFPATPEEGDRGNCRYCDFNRLCPVRRRQIWERKGRSDSDLQPFNALGGQAAIEN